MEGRREWREGKQEYELEREYVSCNEWEIEEGEAQVRRVECPDVDVLANAKLCVYVCVCVHAPKAIQQGLLNYGGGEGSSWLWFVVCYR